MIKIGIIEDNATIRATFQEWFNAAPGMNCLCACATVKEALQEIPRYRPDVVLMDINLPDESGITCTAKLKKLLPDLRIVMVTLYKDYDLIFQALQAGAAGYLLKRSRPEELLQAVRYAQTGGCPMTGEIARMVMETFQSRPSEMPEQALSPRESEILELVAQGLTNKEVASKLNLSFDTIRNRLRNIYDKLHVNSRTGAVMKYRPSLKMLPFRSAAVSVASPGERGVAA
jgi:DNA-binding NarL/FixJ family response regulator